ncbi:hypothetical protein VmeM32_00071 [Vibrio phage vB_VmeM-32]|nr:hypothetical protein VmeM32_00071 [Vibrio phage vB_VmeM-32]
MKPIFVDTSNLTRKQLIFIQERLFEMGYSWFDGPNVRRFEMKPTVITNICPTGQILNSLRYSLEPDYNPTQLELTYKLDI